MFRPNPAPLRVLGRRRRGGHVGGAWEEGSIAPVPSSPARVLGDHPRRMLHWSLPKGADERQNSALLPRLFLSAEMGDWGKLKRAQARATDRVFSRHLLARACKAPRLYRSPLMCAHPSNPTSNLSPAAPFAPTIGPAQSLLTARESHVLHLLACAGMAVNTHGVHLEQAELLLGATAAPAVRFRSAGAGPLQAAGWWSHAVGSGATSSLPLTMIKGSPSISVWWTFSSLAHRRDF